MMKAFLVTAGEYSDYGVRAVFLDRAEAEAYRAELEKTGDCVNDIEEYPIGKPNAEIARKHWRTRINIATGLFEPFQDWQSRIDHSMALPEARSDNWAAARNCSPYIVSITRTSYVSQEHADKLAVESRQALIAYRHEHPEPEPKPKPPNPGVQLPGSFMSRATTVLFSKPEAK